ncbi:MAG: amidohydrolase family protein [Nitrospirota bacterium]|nr:amidohydrolase family protein [Nitrospirota bacterium]MDX2419729.1 amidohydrolase family protein [Nitrospirota bacterium]
MIILSNIHKLYDGTSATINAIHERMDLWIDEGLIKALQPHNPTHPQGSEVQRVDCSAYTVTPGLIDCHGHVTLWGVGKENLDRMNSLEAPFWAERILYRTLVDGGVTTLRDVGGATQVLKRLVEQGVLLGPRLQLAICMLSTTGGHADFRGPDRCCGELSRLWPAGPGRPSSIVDGPWECRKRVREIAACGGDLVKICASPGVISPTDHLEHRDFTLEEMEAICDEAAGRGMYVAAHAHSQSGIRLAIESGVKDLQHISFMNEELAELAYAKGCTVTPTSWVGQRLLQSGEFNEFITSKVQAVSESHARAVKVAHASGLKILAGTDPVLSNMHGRNYMELVALIQEGVPPLAAWFGGTGLAAEQLGLTDTGTVREGRRADLLICQGDVIEDPARLDDGALVEVLKDGWAYRNGLESIPQQTYGKAMNQALHAG